MLEQKLDVYFRARFSLIVLVTVEEERALKSIKDVCKRSNRGCLTWDVAEGFQILAGEANTALPMARDPLTALEKIDQADGDGLVVLKDFHECWANPQIRRKLRSVAQLAQLAEGYVGAEIEQAVIEAMYVGFNAQREFTTADVAAALKRQVPLLVSSRETIDALRQWLREGRAQSASFREVKEALEHFVPVQLDLGDARAAAGAAAARPAAL
jgi:hypothetical protein